MFEDYLLQNKIRISLNFETKKNFFIPFFSTRVNGIVPEKTSANSISRSTASFLFAVHRSNFSVNNKLTIYYKNKDKTLFFCRTKQLDQQTSLRLNSNCAVFNKS
jgi:hypothetical protein